MGSVRVAFLCERLSALEGDTVSCVLTKEVYFTNERTDT